MTTRSEHWRQRAQEARDFASAVQDREVRQAILRIAQDYSNKARQSANDEMRPRQGSHGTSELKGR
jgi:hypothetical protein